MRFELGFDGLAPSGAKSALVLRRATSSRSRPQSPKPARTSLSSALARGAAELADAGDDEAEDGQVLLDLERGAQLGRQLVGERDHGGQAHVGLVDAVVLDGLVVGHADEGRGERDAGGVEGRGEEAFDDAEDGLLRGEGHLEVDLGELGLAVGAQVFVAEAARDLEVAVEAGDHQDLLEDLRRLRQRVEVAGMDAAGDEVVARAFGRGARHEGRFDLEEALGDEVVADGHGDAAAQREVVLHLGAAQVEVAVLQAHLFVGDGVFGGREGRRLGFVEQQQLVGDDFDLAGGHVGVFEARAAAADVAFDGDDVLGARGVGLVVRGADLLVDDDLRDAGAVAQVEEDEVAVVAAAVDPAHQNHVLPRVFRAKLATHAASVANCPESLKSQSSYCTKFGGLAAAGDWRAEFYPTIGRRCTGSDLKVEPAPCRHDRRGEPALSVDAAQVAGESCLQICEGFNASRSERSPAQGTSLDRPRSRAESGLGKVHRAHRGYSIALADLE